MRQDDESQSRRPHLRSSGARSSVFRHRIARSLTCLSAVPLQVYKPSEGRYVFQDKYYGRKVATAQFPSALASFLHDGEKILIHHIPAIFDKLCKLAAIVRQLTRWRFYAASLLFIYDGNPEVQDEYRARQQAGYVPDSNGRLAPGELNIRLIDFAHCTTGDDFLPPLQPGEGEETAEQHGSEAIPRARFPPIHADEPDVGFLLGLQSICNSLKATWNEERRRRLAIDREDDIGHISIPDKRAFDCSLTKEAAEAKKLAEAAAAAAAYSASSDDEQAVEA